MNNKKKKKTIAAKQEKQKDVFVKSLGERPILKIAYDKSGISKATYYRWRDEDAEFAKRADEAMLQSEETFNDLAMHQIISLMKDKHFPAIRFWLERRHPLFNKMKVELSGHVDVDFEFDQEQ